MKPIQFKKIYGHYTPMDFRQKYAGKYASLVTFLSNDIGSSTIEDWLNFIDGKEEYSIAETESVEIQIIDNDLINISLIDYCDENTVFIATKGDLKSILLKWVELTDKRVNGIIMSKKKGKIVLTECEDITRTLKKIRLGRRKRYKNINIDLEKTILQTEEEDFVSYYTSEEKKPPPHPLSTLVRFFNCEVADLLECEIEKLAKNWIKWLSDHNETYKSSECIELKKINPDKILLSDVQKDYAASIDDDPYALYISIDELISLIKEWKKIRVKKPDKIIFSYHKGKISITYENSPVIAYTNKFPHDFFQVAFVKKEAPEALYKELFFPEDWSLEKMNATIDTARQYCVDHAIDAYITNDSKHYRMEGYTKEGIKIRFIGNNAKLLDAFSVVETTYENAMKPYDE